MSAVFALCEEVVGNPRVATFAAIGSFAMLMRAECRPASPLGYRLCRR
jgi:hypothetical protein